MVTTNQSREFKKVGFLDRVRTGISYCLFKVFLLLVLSLLSRIIPMFCLSIISKLSNGFLVYELLYGLMT